MPIVDKPLSELYAYQGTNPKPADFDTYWDRALEEMHALGTVCELIPAAFQTPGVHCDDLYFTGVHGARVYTKLLSAVIISHGYTGNSGNWVEAFQCGIRLRGRGAGLPGAGRALRRRRRRTWVVGIFTNPESYVRLVTPSEP